VVALLIHPEDGGGLGSRGGPGALRWGSPQPIRRECHSGPSHREPPHRGADQSLHRDGQHQGSGQGAATGTRLWHGRGDPGAKSKLAGTIRGSYFDFKNEYW